MKKIWMAILLLASFILGMLAQMFGIRKKGGDKTPAIIKEETYEKIKSTPAADVFDAAPNQSDKRSELEAITAGYRKRLRDRARKIVSGSDGHNSA